jgi:repressor LexA
MIDALVDDGDIVLLKQTQTARDGELVAAWLESESETTLKLLYRDASGIRLQPANRHMRPLHCPPGTVRIQGKVVAVIRKSPRSD